MKYLIFCIVLLVLAGCKQQPSESSKSDNDTVLDVETDTIILYGINCDSLSVELPDEDLSLLEVLRGDTLVPMEMQFEESTNPYEKYGFAFLANCYGCNGIDICIMDSVVSLTGSCGEDLLSQKIRIEKIETTAKDEIVIAVKDARFIFNKVDTIAIYKLTIEGELKLKGEEMMKSYFTQPIEYYYTPRKELHKFTFFDCGDFQG